MAGFMTRIFPPEDTIGSGHSAEDDAPASKSRRKREMAELQKLGERLTTLSRDQVDRMALPPELHEAVLFAVTLTSRGARRRQMQRIGALMRDVDPDLIQSGLERLDQRRFAEIRRFKEAEAWRERIITEGDLAVDDLVAAFPSADRQRIRQLTRNAGKAGDSPKKVQAAKQLFRYVMEILAAPLEPGR